MQQPCTNGLVPRFAEHSKGACSRVSGDDNVGFAAAGGAGHAEALPSLQLGAVHARVEHGEFSLCQASGRPDAVAGVAVPDGDLLGARGCRLGADCLPDLRQATQTSRPCRKQGSCLLGGYKLPFRPPSAMASLQAHKELMPCYASHPLWRCVEPHRCINIGNIIINIGDTS